MSSTGYDLAIVGPAPLPPHERHWRHPSEMAPTLADVDSTPTGRGLVLATGTAAVVMAAIMFVALTPPTSSDPTAVGATTIPSAAVLLQNSSRTTESPRTTQIAVTQPALGAVRIDRNSVSRDNALTLLGAPNAVSAAPTGDADEMDVAGSLPEPDERIIVLTFSHTYDIAWGQIDRVEAPDGSIVMTRDGELIASFVDGALHLLVS